MTIRKSSPSTRRQVKSAKEIQGRLIICTSNEPTISSDSASILIKTGDGRTGDRHEFHLSGTLIRATLDLSGSMLTVWATESALPEGAYDPAVGVQSRYFRPEMSRTQAEGLRDRLSAALGRRRRKKLAQS
jgi:hypothetical protein